jgi:hypothetical protein
MNYQHNSQINTYRNPEKSIELGNYNTFIENKNENNSNQTLNHTYGS